MGSLIKWIVAIPVAAFLTFMLFMGMIGLISGEWEPQDKSKTTKFEINPTVEDIKVVKRETKIDKVKQVVTPPPPPQIERQQADQPTEPIASLEGKIPEFEPPKIERDSFKIAVSDRDAQPLVRIPPIFPPRFLEGNYSGHCRIRFDVSPEGSPFNVSTTFCTSKILEKATVKSVQKWRFNPKIVDGRPVAMRGVENKVTFQLSDERGKVLPEPNR